MRNTLCLLFACSLLCAVAMAQEPDNMKGITERHNFWRAKLGIAPLTWSNELAEYAQNWANKLAARGCILEHSKSQYGENIYWSSYRSLPEDVVDSWASEQKYFNHDNQECKTGAVCGHYTQIIWEDTKMVGCAKAVCEDGSEVWVCFYSPAGNVLGQKPYKKK